MCSSDLYEGLVAELLDATDDQNYGVAVQLASIPEQIRGFGHVRARYLTHAKQREAELLARFRGRGPVPQDGRESVRAPVLMAG